MFKEKIVQYVIITVEWAWSLYSSEDEYSSFGLWLRVYCYIMHKYYTTLQDIVSKRLEYSY